MTAWLVAIISVILVALIVARRVSPAFRRRSEFPKYQFLKNLGIAKKPFSTKSAGKPSSQSISNNKSGEEHEPHQP